MRVPAVVMRGGTSRALFFHESDLPASGLARDAYILAAFGSPDPYRRQIDGLGGATSTTSKVAVIGDGKRHGVDVTYEFGQVGIDQAIIDRRGNCGNISSAVGPFAVDEGLVKATDPITVVKFLNTNTGKVIVAHVPTRNGVFDPTGEFALPGIPGTGSQLQLDYIEPGGAVTGALLPTGNVTDQIKVPGLGQIEVSIVDAANPLVFIRWEDLGLAGLEQPAEIDADEPLLARIESVRAQASVLAGIAPTVHEATLTAPSVPKVSFVGSPREYVATNGLKIEAAEMDLRAAMMSMGRLHTSYPLTGAIATTVAANIPGTIVHKASGSRSEETRIGHPAGKLVMKARMRQTESGMAVDSVSGYRTARRLMDGQVIVPDERLEPA